MSNQTQARAYVDFNCRDEHNDVNLNLTAQERHTLSAALAEGNRLILYDETMEVEGVIKWNEEIKMLVATLDLETIRHLDYTPKQRD